LIETSGRTFDRDETNGCRKVALPITREDPFEPREHDLLETEVRREGSHAFVVLAGEIDVSTVGLVYERLAELARDGVCHASLNLSAVSFMDSTGISMLVSEHKRMESMGGELILLAPPSAIRRLLEISGLDTYFNIRPEPSP
jgi:anti-sigma B factor antagonist